MSASHPYPVLSVQDLHLAYGEQAPVVQGVSFEIAAGQMLALVGESGSGKTSTAQAVMGLLPAGGRLVQGAVHLQGRDLSQLNARQWQDLRGRVISLVPQDPGSSLNPVKTVGAQVAEVLALHRALPPALIPTRVIELLAEVGLNQPALRARQFPHELSGGMKQRVLIAMAVALRPALIIADEPTSALDVTVQKRILDLIDALRREHGTAVLLVTHDLGVAADRAEQLVVLRQGRVQEAGPTARLLRAPQSAYTRQLLEDAPSAHRARPARPLADRSQDSGPEDDAILVQDLVHDFRLPDGQALRAVDGVSFRVPRGRTHALVGESGSGKTTTVRDVLGFSRPSSGRIWVQGVDMSALRGEALRRQRRHIQLVYQNPFASLDPRHSVYRIIEEPLLNHGKPTRAEREYRVRALLDQVGLPEALLTRRPQDLSGGQRQRVAIARALILEPQVLVLDEAVSALDVTVQAQILRLLQDLQDRLGLSYLFITHDLAVVRQLADTVSVLHRGRVVDSGAVEAVFRQPRSDYTRALIQAIPGQRLFNPPEPALP